MEALSIRRTTEDDLRWIEEIYRCAVERKQTAHTLPPSDVYWRNWLQLHHDKYPSFVLEFESRVIGFASISPYREGRQAFDRVAEISYYLHPDHQRKGYGTFFVSNVIGAAKDLGISYLVAILLGSNSASQNLLFKFGFEKRGELPGIANFGEMTDNHVYLGKKI